MCLQSGSSQDGLKSSILLRTTTMWFYKYRFLEGVGSYRVNEYELVVSTRRQRKSSKYAHLTKLGFLQGFGKFSDLGFAEG
mmetsp:Transcript_23063/g.40771  ORF Transcript_23063/g.40771 Transcript_23063/m.40771 type:complete len:81 (-) Transcript_23063:1113-1355(-)